MITSYMSISLPSVSVTLGPAWASQINAALVALDSHNHSPGYGQGVPTAGLDINADLGFNGWNATLLRSVRFGAQGSALAQPTDIGCAYVQGVDLYYNDINGNAIRLTANGQVAAASGSISGLVSPAALTYIVASHKFAFTYDTNAYAAIEGGAVTIHDTAVGALGITLRSPVGLVSAYALILPTTLPVATKLVTLDASGQLSASYDVDNSSLQATGGVLAVRNQGITTARIADLNVTTDKLASLCVTEPKLGPYSVSNAKLQDLVINTQKLADLAVTEGKIAAASISSTKLINSSVTTDKIATGAVNESKIASNAVTTSKVLDQSITYAKLYPLQNVKSGDINSWTNNTSLWTDVTNLSVTITTSGRPVLITIPSNNNGFGKFWSTGSEGQLRILRDGAGFVGCGMPALNSGVACGSVSIVDTPAAGSHTYKVQMKCPSSTDSVNISYANLQVTEL